MKKILLFTLLVLHSYADNVMILTSQPDYKTMTLVTDDGMWANTPIVDSKTYKYTSFSTAYKNFRNSVEASIKKNAKEYNMKGVVNYNIKFTVTEKSYYFTAQYDWFK